MLIGNIVSFFLILGLLEKTVAATPVTSVATMAELKTLDPNSGVSTVLVQGYNKIGDGGGGLFIKLNTDQGVNLGTRIKSNFAGYSWDRIRSGSINVKWFGADGSRDGTQDDTIAIQNAIDTASISNASSSDKSSAVYFPGGTYRVSNLTLHPAMTFYGDGMADQTVLKAILPQGKTLISPMITDDGNAAKINIRNMQINGSNLGFSSILRLGKTPGPGGKAPIQNGTESILDGILVRDAPEATAFEISGNVGRYQNLSAQNVAFGLVLLGDVNMVNNFSVNGYSIKGIYLHCRACILESTTVIGPKNSNSIPVYVTRPLNSFKGLNIYLSAGVSTPNLVVANINSYEYATKIKISSGVVNVPSGARFVNYLLHGGTGHGPSSITSEGIFNFSN